METALEYREHSAVPIGTAKLHEGHILYFHDRKDYQRWRDGVPFKLIIVPSRSPHSKAEGKTK